MPQTMKKIASPSRPLRAVPRGAGSTIPAQAIGRVRVHSDGCFALDLPGGLRVQGRRAASCLLVPEVGDTVAWLSSAGEDGYIFAVIERAGETPQKLALQGDAVIEVQNGSLSIQTDAALKFKATILEADAAEAKVVVRKGTLIFGAIESFGDFCRSTVNQLHLIGKQMSSVFERISETSQNSSRFVEGMDQVQANTMDYQAAQLMNLRSENVLTNGSRLVKTRGGQIHLG